MLRVFVRLPPEDEHVLMGDVRDEDVRVTVRPKSRPGLVPDHVALDREPGTSGPISQIRAREYVPPVLVGVADDDGRVSLRPEDSQQLGEDVLHAGQIGGVVGAVGQVARVVGDHCVVGAPIGMRLGESSARHRDG